MKKNYYYSILLMYTLYATKKIFNGLLGHTYDGRHTELKSSVNNTQPHGQEITIKFNQFMKQPRTFKSSRQMCDVILLLEQDIPPV